MLVGSEMLSNEEGQSDQFGIFFAQFSYTDAVRNCSRVGVYSRPPICSTDRRRCRFRTNAVYSTTQKGSFIFPPAEESSKQCLINLPFQIKHRDEMTIARQRLTVDYGLGDDPDVLFGLADELYAAMRFAECFRVTSKLVVPKLCTSPVTDIA